MVLLINAILMLIFKVNLKNTLKFILKLLPFVAFTAVLNVLLGSIELGIIIGIRLILVCNVIYIFSSKMTPKKFEIAIENTLVPLKIFRVNTREIGIMVSISISFIPILQKEIQNLKYSLISKGFKLNFSNMIKHSNYVLLPLITSVIKKTSEIEYSMLSKGYVND